MAVPRFISNGYTVLAGCQAFAAVEYNDAGRGPIDELDVPPVRAINPRVIRPGAPDRGALMQ